jgi:hypothetical protein
LVQKLGQVTFGLNRGMQTNAFGLVFSKMVRLGEAEAVLRGCGTGSNSSSHESHESFLEIEDQLVKSLRLDVQSSRLAPPLDLAEAIVQVRRNNSSPQSGVVSAGTGTSITANELLTQSGWPDNSANVLRQALAKMGRSCK